ncbi:MAG TPA: NTP transferase domain-containing protein [Coprothermobacter sp.]|nr:NTP transferase domain-containing protein [Coprothermobacter sp.]
MNGLILVAGGKGQRFSGGKGKMELKVFKGLSLLDYWLVRLETLKGLFQDIVIVTDSPLLNSRDIKVAPPGDSRKKSVANGFYELAKVDKVLVHDGARPLATNVLFERVIAWLDTFPVVVPAIDVEDALRKKEGNSTVPVPRGGLIRVQTPQGFRYDALKAVLEAPHEDVDEASVAQQLGWEVHVVEGERKNLKVTFPEDIFLQEHMFRQIQGIGWDFHKFSENKPLFLGGVQIKDAEFGLESWTDGDVVIHAVADAFLSMLGQGDLGTLYPNNELWKGCPSTNILADVMERMRKKAIFVEKVTVLLLADKPKLKHWIEPITTNLSSLVSAPVQLSITRSEGIIGKDLDGMISLAFVNGVEVKR